jgi:hypothetical protein
MSLCTQSLGRRVTSTNEEMSIIIEERGKSVTNRSGALGGDFPIGAPPSRIGHESEPPPRPGLQRAEPETLFLMKYAKL